MASSCRIAIILIMRNVVPYFLVRGAEPIGQDAVFTDAVQNAVGADNGGIDGARQHEEPNDYDERLEEKFQSHRADEIHGNATDHVIEILWSHTIRDDRVSKERDQRCEQQRIDEDHHPCTHQVLCFGYSSSRLT